MNRVLPSIPLLALVVTACTAPPAPMAAFQAPRQPSLAGFSAPSHSTSPVRMELKAQTFLLEEPQSLPVVVTAEQLIFEGEQRFEMGQVLMGRSVSGQAFLRRVVQVRSMAGQTLVETEPAYLTDAFEELDAQGAEPLERVKPIELDRRSFKIGFVTLDSVLKAQPDFSDARLTIRNGKALFVRLAPELKLNWDVTGKTSFSTLDAPLTAGSEPDLKPIGSVNFKNFIIPTQIGPVPVTFFIRPGAALSWGHQGSGSVQLGAQVNGHVKAGVELSSNFSDTPDIKTLFDYGYDGQFSDPRIEFNGKVRTRLHIPRIRVESEIVEMTGPYVEAESFIDGDLTARMSVVGQQKKITGTAEAHLGLGLKAGLPATHLFGKQITKEIHKTLFNRRIKELYNRPIDYTLPIE